MQTYNDQSLLKTLPPTPTVVHVDKMWMMWMCGGLNVDDVDVLWMCPGQNVDDMDVRWTKCG